MDKNWNICQICQKKYAHLSHLAAHISRVHNISYKDYYDRFFKTEKDGKCRVCGKPTIFSKGLYRNYCSRKCQNNHPSTKLKNSLAVQHAKRQLTIDQIQQTNQKRLETCLHRYGTQNISQLSDIKQKVHDRFIQNYGDWYLKTDQCRQKFRNKYGVANALQVPSIQTQVQQTNLEKYGQTSPAKNEMVKEKIRQTKREKYYQHLCCFKTVRPLFAKDEYINQFKIYPWKCTICGTLFHSRAVVFLEKICPTCFPDLQKNETDEKLLQAFFEKSRVEVLTNKRLIIEPLELDYYFPKNNLAIEYNGLYWHSENGGKKDKNYHLLKTEMCQKKNIRLIHIFEDEWIENKKIIFSKLKYLLKLIKYRIYARNCEVRMITSGLKNRFLNKYHLQGADQSQIHLGLFYRNRLVAVMTFSKLRKALGQTHKEGSWELSRFCSLNNFAVVGGAAKLFKYFEKNYSPKKIISYADRRWSEGNLYFKLGFQLDHISKPNYWYIPYGGKYRFHRFNFRKNVLAKKLEKYDPNLSEWKNMQNNGYDRIWDCGNLVFVKTF